MNRISSPINRIVTGSSPSGVLSIMPSNPYSVATKPKVPSRVNANGKRAKALSFVLLILVTTRDCFIALSYTTYANMSIMKKKKIAHRHHHQAHLVHLTRKQQRSLYENSIIAASYVYPLTGIPQAITVLQGNIEGVSVISWASFAIFGILFLSYGIKHKVKPMIIVNSLWLVIDIIIVAAVLYHRI